MCVAAILDCSISTIFVSGTDSLSCEVNCWTILFSLELFDHIQYVLYSYTEVCSSLSYRSDNQEKTSLIYNCVYGCQF
jgi:hypothetical protein